MHICSLSLCGFVWWALPAPFEVDARPRKIQHVLPRLLEERSSEGRLTLRVNDDIVLNLEKTSAFSDTFELVLCRERENLFQEMTTSNLVGEVYKDGENHTAVLVSRDDGLRIKGIIGGELKIDHDENVAPDKDGLVLHFLKEITHNTFDQSDSRILDDAYDIIHSDHIHLSGGKDIVLSQRSAESSARVNGMNGSLLGDIGSKGTGYTAGGTGARSITVETKVVVSHHYAAAFQSSDYSQVTNLIDYLRVLFGFVNVVFSKFSKKVLDLQLTVTGIVLLEEKTESFLHKLPQADAMELKTLESFQLFIAAKSTIFVEDDIVLYLSSYRLGRVQGGILNLDAAGYAPVGGACTTSRGGLVSDRPKEFEGVYTIAHEIMHLLGCVHDGEPAPEYLKNSPGGMKCSGHGSSVMASVQKGGTMLSLSACTQSQVIAYVKNQRGHCLLSKVTRHTKLVASSIMEKIFIDRQKYCERVLPGKSNVQFMPYYDQEKNINKCALLCSWPDTNALNVRMQTAPDYTPCSMEEGKVLKMCLYKTCTTVPRDVRSFGGSLRRL